jgi:hypothetical protein
VTATTGNEALTRAVAAHRTFRRTARPEHRDAARKALAQALDVGVDVSVIAREVGLSPAAVRLLARPDR